MKRFLPLLLTLLILSGCGSGDSGAQKQVKTVYAMDTVMTLTAYEEKNGADVSSALDAAEMEIRRLDALLSPALESSDIYKINQNGEAVVSWETGLLLQRALEIAEMTDGAFDPTVYPLMQAWGFATENGEHHYQVPKDIPSILSQTGYQKLHLDEITAGEHTGQFQVNLPETGLTGLDLGGIAKGYTAHEVIEVLERQGVASGIISLGGNVATLGRKPDGSLWFVAVENPAQNGDYLASLQLDGGWFAITSGAYERYFEQDGVRYHHILDPATGYPANSGLESVTIVSRDGTLADALSTALFVMGAEQAQTFWRAHSDAFEMILYDGVSLYVTPGLKLDTTYPVVEVQP